MKITLKGYLSIILIFVLAISLNACAEQKDVKVSTAKMKHVYKSMKELKDSAVEIVEVEVLENSESIVYKQVPFTISKVKILSCLKGELKSGDEIKIIETGAVIDGNPVFFDGVPVVQPEKTMILFLDKYEGPVTENAYIPLGEYMGKFIIEEDKVVQQAIDEYKLKDYSNENLKEFKEKIKGIK